MKLCKTQTIYIFLHVLFLIVAVQRSKGDNERFADLKTFHFTSGSIDAIFADSHWIRFI